MSNNRDNYIVNLSVFAFLSTLEKLNSLTINLKFFYPILLYINILIIIKKYFTIILKG